MSYMKSNIDFELLEIIVLSLKGKIADSNTPIDQIKTGTKSSLKEQMKTLNKYLLDELIKKKEIKRYY